MFDVMSHSQVLNFSGNSLNMNLTASADITASVHWVLPTILIILLLFIFALAQHMLRTRFPRDEVSLIDSVDNLLPQTQCAQCGYPGCRPYAQAIVDDSAPLNLCPPGGESTFIALLELMGNNAQSAQAGPQQPAPAAVVVIDETKCIGCTLCLPPCPVDAIVGAQGFMHSIITEECTGCELCIPACPVDCISLQLLPEVEPAKIPRKLSQRQLTANSRACISCARCEPVCPAHLPAQSLLHLVEQNRLQEAHDLGLAQCIECGLCDQACPSDIPMAQIFIESKHSLKRSAAEQAEQLRLKQRYTRHTTRLEAQAQEAKSKRQERLREKRSWQ